MALARLKNNPAANELLKSFDWTATALGDSQAWSQSLRTSISICLNSKFPIIVLWGSEMIQIYNDAYKDMIGLKHPRAYGAKAKDVWAELWPEIGPMLDSVLKNGESFLLENHPFTLNRKGYDEQRYFTFSYSPVYNDTHVEGIFVSVNDTTEIILNNQNLRKLRDKQLKNLFVQAPIALSILRGPDHVIEVANDEILKLWGKTSEEVMDKPVFEAIPEARDQGYEDLLNRVFTTGERVVIHESPLTLIRYGKQEDFFIKLTYEALREEDGIISGIMVLAEEITEQVTTRKRIEESEMRQRIAIDAAQIGTFDLDLQRSEFKFSERLANIFGYSESKGLTREKFVERIHPDDVSHRMEALERALKTGTLSYEARILWLDNSVHWIRENGKVVYDKQSRPWRMFGTTLDITDQKTESERLEMLVEWRTVKLKEQHEELKRSEERYHKMVEEVQDYAIILLDKDGIIQNWNKGAEKIKQYREQEVIGRPFHIFYLPLDRATRLPDKLLNEAAKNGRAVHEGWRLRKDQTRFCSIAITALHDDNNNVIGFSKVTRDLTERKESEDRLRDYTKELESQNQELEQFAYVASHDLQEPLRKIQTFSEILHKNLHNEEIAKTYLKKVDSSAKRMAELIKSVLNYSRLSNGGHQVTEVALDGILKNVTQDFELLIQEKDAVIESEPLPLITGISLHLNQLFANLIGNSLKFTERNPIIKISSRPVRREQVVNSPSNLEGTNYIEVAFSDNGIGFDQQFEKQIFTMFQRLHGKHEFSGTGIGLAICKKIMENHGGYITARSEVGKGATFYVYFPFNA
ncbi:MAG TPA: PAS domain S-box protein [Cyclobacteriaceae bacterium]|nr:PAS domain S-box protein [Cyclobacteriaceae bacterium]